MKGSAQALALESQQDARPLDDTRQPFDFRGPWFTTAEGAAYIRSKSVPAFRLWLRRKHIVPRHRGTHILVAKADLDRAIKAKRPKRVMAPASLANLRKKRG